MKALLYALYKTLWRKGEKNDSRTFVRHNVRRAKGVSGHAQIDSGHWAGSEKYLKKFCQVMFDAEVDAGFSSVILSDFRLDYTVPTCQ